MDTARRLFSFGVSQLQPKTATCATIKSLHLRFVIEMTIRNARHTCNNYGGFAHIAFELKKPAEATLKIQLQES